MATLAGKEIELTQAGPTMRKEALAYLHFPFRFEICFTRMLGDGDSKGRALCASREAIDPSHCAALQLDYKHMSRD